MKRVILLCMLNAVCVIKIHAQSEQWEFKLFSGVKEGFKEGHVSIAEHRSVEGIAIDKKGNLYFTDYRSSVVFKIDTKGNLKLLAGQPMKTGFADGPAAQSLIDRPHGITVDKKGNVYFCDMKNHLIRKIDTKGNVSTFAGVQGQEGTTDGTRLQAKFNKPEAIVIDSKGNLFVTDTYNFTIRKIDTQGIVSTVAGVGGEKGYSEGKGIEVRLDKPIGLCIDEKDNLYFTDSDYDGKPGPGNNVIRKLDKNGIVTTLAGKQGVAGHKDGPALEAEFNRPVGIAVDKFGNLYIADTEADLIRKIDTKGIVTTLGGQYLEEKKTVGIGSEATFFDPQALIVGKNGELYITDTLNNRVIIATKNK
ncbi:MAG: hypothetical protein ACRCVT_13745 [Leadbetterella sp.]